MKLKQLHPYFLPDFLPIRFYYSKQLLIISTFSLKTKHLRNKLNINYGINHEKTSI